MKEWAIEQRIVPIVKMRRARRRMGLRPMMCEKEAHAGWKTVEVRRKDVPVQKSWMAVPLRILARVWEDVRI